ncbi:MAG: MarR family transcriptional regulator [Proteobacteria bacterium]|nr:MarR family transcriptional regulator [Pseudomonadota bacterium]
MSTLPKQLSECTVFLLAKAYQRAHGEFKKLLKPYGLTNIQHLVLESLRHEPGATAAEIGKLLVLDKATLSGVIDRLCESEWIVKKSDSGDSRVQRVYLLDKSLEIAEKISEKRHEFDEALLTDFSIEERVLLKRLLKELI